MIVLAVDTAGDACSAAVVADGCVLAARREPMERGHQERLASLVREAMGEAGIAFGALDRIAVTTGPGSFTGLRVGLAFARAMALALGVPCLGVGRLEGLAAGIEAAEDAVRIAAIDGRRGQIYVQAFKGERSAAPPAALELDAARAWAAEFPGARVVGSGAGALLGVESGADEVDPVVLARLAAARDPAAAPPDPLYLRAPEARTLAERGRPEPSAVA